MTRWPRGPGLYKRRGARGAGQRAARCGAVVMGLPGAVRGLIAVLLAVLVTLGEADEAPKVEVYSRDLVTMGKENTLNCFVSGFHPPKIEISLLKNGKPMDNVKYTDLSFNDKWYFQRLAYAPFTPQQGDVYVCRVAHSAFKEPQSFQWDADF
ncbi:beta-2-microglobulin [Strigops habroptila]|uniref:Beta-2-microglobulin n=1 Tax=Strigops habroptila TaxID=2489341 RepID=A0A672UP97_STRHB|nr:beta-2-microglobulin [Strigops habroptila]